MRFWLKTPLYEELSEGSPGDGIPPVIAVIPEPQTEDDLDDIVSLGVLIDEKQDEILEDVAECQTKLDQLLKTETAENPLLNQLVASIQSLQTQLIELTAQVKGIFTMVERKPDREPSELIPVIPGPPEISNSPKTGESTNEPKPEDSQVPKPDRKRHVNKL